MLLPFIRTLPLLCYNHLLVSPDSATLRLFLPTMASGDDSPIFEDDESPPYSLEKMTDLVAVWDVALSDGVHKIEFEHGTTSGKRVVYVDGKEEIRKEWMFKLVGKETFYVGAAKTKATINIDAISGFAYEYTLEINGKSLKKYMEDRSKTTNTWVLHMDGENFRIVLEKDAMDVWCNGKKLETAGEFVDDGTETHFSIGNHDCYIKAVSSGKRKEGIIHTLIVDNREIPEIAS
ncbi:fas apoptotic inhibitory molecule 1 isoform X1 [Homo sapiens]|nr:fas apoptotic inhibitory molecule 1 isoform X1 [Homo sapiens]XP_054203045.1 fas apoptotic inhibitory molecule 1 isoform X1 [Homo sapiens]|eukprot:XP_011511252.1 fas apoptotic inhibitory molecule 1 isoform X1 [Homo sapiens]